MKLKMLGVNFPHKKGEFCRKARFSHYTIYCCATPFLYLRNGSLIEGEADEIVINTPHQPVYHGPRADSKEGFVNDWVYIEGEDMTALLEKYPLPLNTAFSVNEKLFLRSHLNRLLAEYNSDMPGSADMINSLITQMIIAIYRAYHRHRLPDDRYREIASVRRAIRKNPADDWSLQKMSAMSGYSVSRFSELYHKLHGISPINDVIHHRIALAKTLLLSGQASISYVATTCGFNSINYFSKLFKSITGYTPSAYIKTAQNRI